MNTVLFVGGGSIGHIAPSIAVWETLKEKDASLHAFFVCSARKEDVKFLEEYDVNFAALDAPRMSLTFPIKFLKALRNAREILEEVQPKAIFSKGGYVSVPICLAAKKMGIPIVLHESDVVSGRANAMVSKWAEKICTGFALEEKDERWIHTGNPVRAEVSDGSREKGLQITGFSGEKPILLIVGGSQGAQSINESFVRQIDAILEVYDVIHITGSGKQIITEEKPGYWSCEFAQEELRHLYACSALALSRAGAGSIAELQACKIPMIIVPLRGVAHDHQQQNALYLEQQGLAIVAQQEELDGQWMNLLSSLLDDEEKMKSLREKMDKESQYNAAMKIADVMLNCLAKK